MKTYYVDGHEGVKYSIWDHGDEMCVNRGPLITDETIARIRPEVARRLDDGGKRQLVVSAASSIRVADLLGTDSPTFHLLWA